MASSVYQGLNNVLQTSSGGGSISIPETLIFPAQVLDVVLSESDVFYESPRDIGLIRFRNLIRDNMRVEDEIINFAYPIDRAMVRYPYPGEQVIITQAFGEPYLTPNKTPKEIPVRPIYFYSNVVALSHNISYNVNPELATDPKIPTGPLQSLINSLSPPDPSIFYTRFDRRTVDISSVKSLEGNIKVYPQLRPYEGDVVLQGRFGNSIRFGSTSTKIETPWSKGEVRPGSSGDGIMILRVDDQFVSEEKDMLTGEDISTDAASIYLTTTQKVDLILGGSKELKTWQATYKIGPITTAADSSSLYQAAHDILDSEPYTPSPLETLDQEPPQPGFATGTVIIEVPQLPAINYAMDDLSFKTSIASEKTDLGELLGVKGGVNSYTGGPQLLLNSDRVIVNARENYLMLFGQEGVAVSSQGNVNIDADDAVTVFGEDGLFLGVPAKGAKNQDGTPVEGITKQPKNKAQPTVDSAYEPLVLGTKLVNLIDDLLKVLQTATILTPVGKGAFREDVQYELEALQARLPEMLSTFAYVDGISHNSVLAEPTPPATLTEPPTTLTGTVTIPLPETTNQQTSTVTNPFINKPKYPTQPSHPG